VPSIEYFFAVTGEKNINPKKKKEKKKQARSTTGIGNVPSIAAVTVAFGTMPPL
jgi:hypothetical protein